MGGFGSDGFRGDKTNSVVITGAAETQDRMLRLSQFLSARYLPAAMNRAVAPMRGQLFVNTPVGPTGNLRRAVASRILKYQNGTVFAVVGYKRAVSLRTADNRGFHSHLVEFGTRERVPRRRPFLSSYGIADWTPPGWSGKWPMVARRVQGSRAMHPLGNAYMATSGRCVAILTAEMKAALNQAVDDLAGSG